MDKKKVVIIGAGPAGLTAGIELLKTEKFEVTVLERDAVVGGLARTTEFNGCRFDIGPHHFITTIKKVESWWKELMQGDFHPHKRFTRIFYNKHFFFYPLRPLNALIGLNPLEAIRCVASYFWVQLFPYKQIKSFQEYVINKFGYRLFSIFFKTYTEKLWGIKCTEISPDWAAQRIKGFSLFKAVFYAFFGWLFPKAALKSSGELFAAESDTFYYPAKGSGVLWEKAAQQLESYVDGTIFLNEAVYRLEHHDGRISKVFVRGFDGAHRVVQADYFLSTMPLRILIKNLYPAPPQEVINAANAFVYRGLVTINLIINKRLNLPDHWIYIHEKRVQALRIGIMNNFSSQMVDDQNHTALSLEYFDTVDSALWKLSEKELVQRGSLDLEIIGLVKAEDVLSGMVQWTSEAYPVYDKQYQKNLETVLEYLKQFSNLKLMGRNGMHRYFNMDIAMMTAFKAVEELVEDVQKEQVNHIVLDKTIKQTETHV